MVVTRGRTRSTGRQPEASFPIAHLKDVIELVRLIDKHGGRMRYDEIASTLGQKRDSGAFRGKTAAGHMFGATETVSREASLTDLGRRMAAPDTEADALVEAFLNVPLYRALFTRYAADGGKLPMTRDIDVDIERLGVSPNRAAKARQVFLRSAEIAGYFKSGRDRLIRPSAGSGSMPSRLSTAPEPRKLAEPTHQEAGRMADHPLIHALVAQLPTKGERFTAKQRQRWLDAVKVNLDLIYAEDDEEPASTSPNGVANAHTPVS